MRKMNSRKVKKRFTPEIPRKEIDDGTFCVN